MIGQRLKELMKIKSISQAKLALILNVTPVTISQWVTEKTDPKLSNLQALSELFNVDFGWLCTGSYGTSNYGDILLSVPYLDDNNELSKKEFMHFDIKTISNINSNNIACIKVLGNSMEPVLHDNSIVIVDLGIKNIKDGYMYAFKQNHAIRIKLAAYTSTGITFKSYNSNYEDENYSISAMNNLKILGQVVYYATEIV